MEYAGKDKVMRHNTEGLTRECNRYDLFFSGDGIECGNCGAYHNDDPKVFHLAKDIESLCGNGVLGRNIIDVHYKDKELDNGRWCNVCQRLARDS
jgi:hypothetical protein